MTERERELRIEFLLALKELIEVIREFQKVLREINEKGTTHEQ